MLNLAFHGFRENLQDSSHLLGNGRAFLKMFPISATTLVAKAPNQRLVPSRA